MFRLKQSNSLDNYLGIPMNSTKPKKEALEAVLKAGYKDGR